MLVVEDAEGFGMRLRLVLVRRLKGLFNLRIVERGVTLDPWDHDGLEAVAEFGNLFLFLLVL